MDKINCLVYLYTRAKLEGEFVWIYRTLLEYTWLNQPSYIRVGNTFVNYCSLNKVIDLLFFIWCPINHYASLLQISNAMQMECSQTQWKFMIKISGFFWLMENAPWAIPLQSLNWKENPLGYSLTPPSDYPNDSPQDFRKHISTRPSIFSVSPRKWVWGGLPIEIQHFIFKP